MKSMVRLAAVFLIVFIVDGVSKIWAEKSLELYRPIPIIDDFFRLTLGYNTGVAFGMFTNGGFWPLILTGVIIAGLVIWLTRGIFSGEFPGWTEVPIGLLLGGAIGNFVDRLYDGRVTDFIDVGIGQSRWPTFNLADSFILIGVGFLMLISFLHKEEEPTQSQQLEASPSEDEVNTFIA